MSNDLLFPNLAHRLAEMGLSPYRLEITHAFRTAWVIHERQQTVCHPTLGRAM